MESSEGPRASRPRGPWGLLSALYLPAILVVAGLVGVSAGAGIPLGDLTRDPACILNAPFYTGFLSNLGMLLWSSAAAICFFGRVLVRRGPRELSRFLLHSGALTAWLVLDDVFLLHERVIPRALGVPEILVYAAYGGVVLLYLGVHLRTILRTELYLLLAALGFFGLSILADVLLHGAPYIHAIEDGFKLLGIVSWLAYFARTCHASCAGALGTRESAENGSIA